MVSKIIIGLGNPEPQYAQTRHNAGFHVLGELCGTACLPPLPLAETFALRLGSVEAIYARPTTGMNSSGLAVKALLELYGLTPADLLIVYDDVALPLGRLRVQHRGGAGGHHGIESAIEQLGGVRDFDRIKLGVGPDPGGAARFNFVLEPIASDQLDLYRRCVQTAADAVKVWLSAGVQQAMNQFNGVDLR